MKKQYTVVGRIKSELYNNNNNNNNNSNGNINNNEDNNALHNKGLILNYRNILSLFDNDFVLTVI